ncbi:MAG: efflux RND transporter permease subunit [Chloroflexi bacterium]|nr:efflux RND transporter permease subunit [Chloroflexota bacterium]
MFLSDVSIKRPVFITMIMAALIVVGLIAYSRLAVDLFPDTSTPVVTVRTSYPGASPEIVETEITQILEETMSTLAGVKSVESTSSAGSSSIRVEYELDYPVDKAVNEVRERVAWVQRRLPRDAEAPLVLRFDPSMSPFLMFSVADASGKTSQTALRRFVDERVAPRIERVDGVAAVDVNGGRQREIQVLLSLDRLQALGLSPQQVSAAIRTENLDVPGGLVTDNNRELTLSTPGNFKTIDEIGNAVVFNRGGVAVRVKDVALVQDGFRVARSYTRLDGQDSVLVMVRKQSGTNTLQVAARTNELLKNILDENPNLNLVVTRDESEFIRTSVDDTLRDLLLGGLLACFVVFLFFLNWRMTFITVIGLPVIVIGTFWAISLLGFSLNMITLLALSLCIGLLIDDAIVVRENMFRHLEKGEDPRTAAGRGTAEIALAVLAMTLSIVSVFMPIAFATGMIGKLFKQFGITVSLAVFISLFEAFTLAPMLASRFDPRGRGGKLSKGLSLSLLIRGYRGFLSWAMGHRLVVIGVAVAVFAGSLFMTGRVGQGFAADMDQGYFEISLQQPPGTTLETSDRIALEAERRIREEPEVAHLLARVGSGSGPEESSISVRLKERGKVRVVQQRLRAKLANLDPNTRIRYSSQMASLTGSLTGAVSVRGRPILVAVQSNGSLEDLDAASIQVARAIAQVPGAIDVDRNVKPPRPALRIEVERARAAEMGLSTAFVGATVRNLVYGETASQFRDGAEDIDIIVRLREEDRQRAMDILSLPMASATKGAPVRLAAVSNLVPSTEPFEINRLDRQRQIMVGGAIQDRPQGDVIADVQKRLEGELLPPGVSFRFTGQSRQMQESFRSLYFVMALSVLFMYMVLASQLGSFVQPLIVMLALPLSLVGAMGALLVTGKSLDITAMIGMILLMGIVTKNSILLLDFANNRRREGASAAQAMIEAGQVRLRPVLMTSAALIMGMLPVAWGIGAGGEFRSPMAITVIGGLITSTMLTLIVVPVVYTFVEGLKKKVARSEQEE